MPEGITKYLVKPMETVLFPGFVFKLYINLLNFNTRDAKLKGAKLQPILQGFPRTPNAQKNPPTPRPPGGAPPGVF